MKLSSALFYSLLFHFPLFSTSCIASAFQPPTAQLNLRHFVSHSSHLGSRRTLRHRRPSADSPSSLVASSSSALSSVTASSQTPSTTTEPAQSTGSSVLQPTQSAASTASQDISVVSARRAADIVSATTGGRNIPAWVSTLGSHGKWPDSEVDYTTGCSGQRANWPAQTHWKRIVSMAAAWHGGLKDADKQLVNSSDLRASISLAMDYWFSNDFTNPSCLDFGGTSSCPCGTPGFWNTNWYSNIILIPGFVGETCLLLNDTLSESQLSNCTHMTGRAYGTFGQDVHGLGYLTGSNTLDVARIGIDLGLLTVNASLITDAYGRVHGEMGLEDKVKADGIRPDGSFGQHAGILYSGNYGKDYTNDILGLEIEAGGTGFAANDTSKSAFTTLIDGDQWMIYRNIITGVLHWDFSVLGRFISFPVADNQATGSIKINVTQVQQLGQEWQSSVLLNVSTSLSKNTTNANVGSIKGNRMFYNNDYMVHRGPGYVTTVKMYSSRTRNTECTNSQNPFGFHLADGTVYTYLQGNEYEDIAGAWDWNLIPGITTDYGATPLGCNNTGWTGVETFVGGVSDGEVGIAVMRYTNPYTKTLQWQKTWFFLEDNVQHVMVCNIVSTSGAAVYSVLDQRIHTGDVYVDGETAQASDYTGALSLWHGNIGYVFDECVGDYSLSVQYGNKTGNWSSIGISTQPPPVVDLFAAWIEHTSLETPVSYTVFPSIDLETFQRKSDDLQVKTVQNDGSISAIFDNAHETALAVFWDSAGGSVLFTPDGGVPITITSDGNAAVVYRADEGTLTVSDPSQTLTELHITLTLGDRVEDLEFQLPTGGAAGSSISQSINDEC